MKSNNNVLKFEDLNGDMVYLETIDSMEFLELINVTEVFSVI